jgi:hypothetical protein
MRHQVGFEELASITTETTLDNMKVGECFIAVRTIGAPHRWPVYQKTATGYVCLEDGKSTLPHQFEGYEVRRLKAGL